MKASNTDINVHSPVRRVSVTSVAGSISRRTAREGKRRAYRAFKEMYEAGKNTYEIAQSLHVKEAVVYNTLARVDAIW